MKDQNPSSKNSSSQHENQIREPIIELPGDERDVLIARIIDSEASAEDWTIFRSVASNDPSIWSELADSQELSKMLSIEVDHHVHIADRIELPGGVIDDHSLKSRMNVVSRWGGWAAAAAIMLVWFFGNPVPSSSIEDDSQPKQNAGIPGRGLLLNEAQPNQALDQYLAAGHQTGQVIGEMPEQIVIETRPMPDGTIEVLYLRQIIERQIINHAYREAQDEWGNSKPVPVKITPRKRNSF